MKRNILRSVLIILCALLCAVCVACKGDSAPEESSTPPAESSTPTIIESSTPEIPEENPEPHEHVFAPEWDKNDIYHWHNCTLCDADNDVEKHDTEVIFVNKEPTADAPGEGILACKVCGAIKEGEIPPLGNE